MPEMASTPPNAKSIKPFPDDLPAVQRFLFINELVEQVLDRNIFTATNIMNILSTNATLKAIIGGTPALQRKTFKAAPLATKTEGQLQHDNTTLNNTLIPNNVGAEPFERFAKKIRFTLRSLPDRIFEAHWAENEHPITHVTLPVLCIETFTYFTAPRYKVIKGDFADTTLTSIHTAIIASLKCEMEGVEVHTNMWIPSGVKLGNVLEAVNNWANGVMTEESGLDVHGMYVDQYLIWD